MLFRAVRWNDRSKEWRMLLAAEAAGFDVIITVDQNIAEQQNIVSRVISLLILCGPTNRLSDLKPLVADALINLRLIEPGQVVHVRR